MSPRTSTLDFLALGDTTTDVFMEISEATVNCTIDTKQCQLCINYADKLPVERLTTVHAVGNAANAANGAARLGLRAGLWTMIGDDDNGRAARAVFRTEGVWPKLIETDRKHATNFSAVITKEGERTILVYHEERTYQLPSLPKSQWVYLTSMGHGWERIIPALKKSLAATGAKLGFNPGTHQMKSGLSVLGPLFALTEVLLLNREEAARVLGTDTKDVSKLLRGLAECGVKRVVITDGPAGTYAYDGEAEWFMPPYPDPKPPVERTGCGDSFSTGFIGAMIATGRAEDGLKWGSANARMVIQYIGAREGLQTRKQIEAVLKKFPEVKPKRIK